MLITGKIKKIIQNDPSRDIYNVILHKTRKKKSIEIAIIFWGHLSATVKEERFKIGETIDVQVYVYSKSYFRDGKEFYNSYIVAQSWRHYVKGKERYREVVNENTGEVIKRRDEIITENVSNEFK